MTMSGFLIDKLPTQKSGVGAAEALPRLTRYFVVNRPILKVSGGCADMRIFSTLDTVGRRG